MSELWSLCLHPRAKKILRVHKKPLCTSAEDVVHPGGEEAVGMCHGYRDAGVRRVELNTVAAHVVLQVLAHRQVCHHRDLYTSIGVSLNQCIGVSDAIGVQNIENNHILKTSGRHATAITNPSHNINSNCNSILTVTINPIFVCTKVRNRK